MNEKLIPKVRMLKMKKLKYKVTKFKLLTCSLLPTLGFGFGSQEVRLVFEWGKTRFFGLDLVQSSHVRIAIVQPIGTCKTLVTGGGLG